MAKTDIFPLEPDYPLDIDRLDGVLRSAKEDGSQLARRKRADRQIFNLEFRSRSTDEIRTLLQFWHEFADQPFIFHHKVAARGSWNLLGLDAEAEHQTTGGYNFKKDGSDRFFPLAEMGLKVGDVLSILAELKTSAAGGDSCQFEIGFRGPDTETGVGNFFTGSESGTSYVLHKKENFVVPANSVFLIAFNRRNGATEDVFIRRAKVNRGAVAEAFDFSEVGGSPAAVEFVPRFYLVRFMDAPPVDLAGFESNDSRVRLVEAVGELLLEVHYPDPLDGLQTTFLEETRGTAVVGSWNENIADISHGPGNRALFNLNDNTTDKFRWIYEGYGFRLWVSKNFNRGIGEILLDGVSLGNVDQYAASAEFSAPLLAKLDVPLGLHSVTIKATNTKNGAATQNVLFADALEVVR